MSPAELPTVIETRFYVRYAETDAMGVVHHGSYATYFEEGRSNFMRTLGSDYALIEASGFRLPVTEINARFVGSLRYGDRVIIRTWIGEHRSRTIRFDYEVLAAGDSTVLVTGHTRHVWTDSRGQVTRIPERWQAILV